MNLTLWTAAFTVVGTVLVPSPTAKSERLAQPVSRVIQPVQENASQTPSRAADRASRNRVLARSLAKPFGWHTGRQWTCLVRLWHRESRWDDQARNKTSGAYGIPQKMGDPITNPAEQIRWGLRYIERRYGTACAALDHSLRTGWY